MMRIHGIITMLAAILIFTSCGGQKQEKEETQEVNPDAVIEQVFLTDLHCDGCVNTIQGKLPESNGIVSAEADLESKKVKVAYDPGMITEEGVIEAFADLLYSADATDDDPAAFVAGAVEELTDSVAPAD